MRAEHAAASPGETPWIPPSSLEERIKRALVPPRLGLMWDLARERRAGEREIRLVPGLADPQRLSVDVGANRGVWTEALRRHSRGVIAFEPNPKMFEDLSRRLGPGARALPYALSDASGPAELRIPLRRKGFSNQGGTLAHESLGTAAYGRVRVEARRLDELDLGDVGLIKIDVEGHEHAVLRGAAGVLAACRPTLVVEMEEKHLRRPIADAIAEVEAYGYCAFCVQGDGLVPVASLDLPRIHGPAVARRDYVFNWVFRPARPGPALAESPPSP